VHHPRFTKGLANQVAKPGKADGVETPLFVEPGDNSIMAAQAWHGRGGGDRIDVFLLIHAAPMVNPAAVGCVSHDVTL